MSNVRTKAKTAREMCGMTQARVAELLYMSEGNLRRIENGQQACSKEIAQAMAELYKAPWVADDTVAEDYRLVARAETMLRYINERDDVERVMPRLRRILADGVIDETEMDESMAAAKEIEEERAAGRDLLYAI